jgi:malate dehydrogenase (oxaloacetate-decarboxylating)(NADP+)
VNFAIVSVSDCWACRLPPVPHPRQDCAGGDQAADNLVGVITNGTAVLGLGNIGPLAGKPVMEGKGVLFKKFAGIDVFDIETGRERPDKLVDMIAAWSPPSAASTSKTSRRPSASTSRRKLRERMKIPVFHDDQHGTAIVVGAAILNGLKVVGKKVEKSSWSPPAPAPRRWPASTCW